MEHRTSSELYKACHILFGPEVDVSSAFLDYIQTSGLKSAYRRKAMMTHPDTAASRGLFEEATGGTEDFLETRRAYEDLMSYIKLRDTRLRRTPYARTHRPAPQHEAPQHEDPPRASSAYTAPGGGTTSRGARSTRAKRRPRAAGERPHAQHETGGTTRPTGKYYSGKLPPRTMLFGEFLFYSGAVPWEGLIKALVWQRSQRPKLGAIAQKWGWLTKHQVEAAIMNRRLGEPVGEAAYRLRFISRAQLGALVNYQRRLQQPLGEFFVQAGYVTRADMNAVHARFEEHNGQYGR